MARAKPYCPDCVEDPILTSIQQGECQKPYDDVDRCMKAHKGNVADCVPQWKAFRDCHEAQRTLREAQRTSQGQQATSTASVDVSASAAPKEVKSRWRQWQDAIFKTS